MNKFILLLNFCVAAVCAYAQIGVNWDNEISVSDGSVYGRQRPRIALTANDVPVILYGKTSGLYVSRWNGSGFDTPVSLMPAGMQTYIADWTGPDIAAKGDTVIVVFKAMPLDAGNVYSVRSVDGGQTFSDTIRVDSHPEVAWLPSVAIDENGNPLVSYMIHDAGWTNPRYVLAESSDAGLTYTSEISVITSIPGEACDCCPSELAVSGQKRALLFRNNENNVRDMYAVYSEDGGLSYPYQVNVDETAWYVTSCPSTGPHGTFIGDQLVTVFTTGVSGNYRTALSLSDLSTGFSFTSTFQDDDPLMNRNFPRISSSGDTAVMAWRQYYGSLSDVYVSVAIGNYSQLLTNGIQASGISTGTQTNPDIILRNGKVFFCYQDNNSSDVVFRSGQISDVSGISGLENRSVTVSPNPSPNGSFVIDGKVSELVLTDHMGRNEAFDMEEQNNRTVINVNNQVGGVYIARFQSEDGNVISAKLVIQ